ncbi:MAG: HEPN/Toprim-associated domain-containing protein [Chitinophagales bacterium]
MGSISQLIIKGHPILSLKNGYNHKVVNLLFTIKDLVNEARSESDRNFKVWGDAYKKSKKIEKITSFKTTARICKDRLSIFGISHSKAKNEYNKAIKNYVESEKETYEQSKVKKEKSWIYSDTLPSFEDYTQTIKETINNPIINYEVLIDRESNHENFKNYVLSRELIIDNLDIRIGLWIIISVLEGEDQIEYDINDVLKEGWINIDDVKNINNEKIILLTEGKTDTEFISACLKCNFNHIENFYHFMDFNASKYEANASRLAQTLKAFVGSGISNKIIALFDNDTAGKKELKTLKEVNFPKNIVAFSYPNIELAETYPTKGPSGEQILNVNGLAGSIELYLGEDCLKIDNRLTPILWSNYVKQLNAYQGSVMNKKQIQDKFRDKIKKNNGEVLSNELYLIIDAIMKAWI